MDTSEIMTRLAEVVAAEAVAIAAAEAMRQRVAAADHELEAARAARAKAIAHIADGVEVQDVMRMDLCIRSAESSLQAYAEAAGVAEQRIAAASEAVDATLRAIASERAAAVQREYEEAEQASLRAVAHRQSVFQRLQVANSIVLSGSAETVARDGAPWSLLPPEEQDNRRQQARDHLRRLFTAELRDAGAAA